MTAELSLTEAQNILGEAEEFFATHTTKNVEFRIEQLRQLRQAILEYEQEINMALYKDLGKSIFESYFTEIGFVLKNIGDTIKNLKSWARVEKIRTPLFLFPASSQIVYEPYGTVLIIGPFNYPFHLLIEPLIGAMAAGNCAILKPSELCPHVSEVMVKMISHTFVPHYIRCVQGGVETNHNLLAVNFRYIFFTGSVNVGKIVMKAAAEHLTPVTLELGGKSPTIVDETANIKWAAQRIVWGKTVNAGQTCIAPDYLLVKDSVKQELIEEIKKNIVEFYGKSPQESQSYGRIVNARHFERLNQILTKDKDYIIYGGGMDKAQLYIEPTLMEIPSWDVASMQEEIFGPILPIITYKNLDEAIEVIQKNPNPLALYLFSKNERTKEKIIFEISSGGVCINDTLVHFSNTYFGFGGVGNSGIGAYHGKKSFQTFSHSKSILEKKDWLSFRSMLPPYKEKALQLIKKIFK